jgi:hypothetical protein
LNRKQRTGKSRWKRTFALLKNGLRSVLVLTQLEVDNSHEGHETLALEPIRTAAPETDFLGYYANV